MKHKKAVQLTLQTIVIVVILLVVTAVMLFVFNKQIGKSEGILDGTHNQLAECQTNPDKCFGSNDNTENAEKKGGSSDG